MFVDMMNLENFLKDFIEIIPFLMKNHADSTAIIVVELYETFSKNLHPLKNTEFLQIQFHINCFFRSYISYFSAEPASLENFFKMLSGYSSIFYEKQKQTMTPPIRKFYAERFENFLKDFIEIIPFLMKIHPDSTDIINQKIETFLRIHLKKSTSSSLAQICWKMTNTNP